MFKKNLNKILFVSALTITSFIFTSCEKEITEPAATPAEEGKTLIYIRAIDKDSSVVESEQVLLR